MKSITYGFLLLFGLAISGCASNNPTVGENMMAQSNLLASYSKQWEKGKKTSKNGEKLLNKGQDRVETGRAEMKQGDFLVKEGTALIESSRQVYQRNSSSAGLSQTPKQVVRESQSLKTIAKNWQKGLDKIKDGNELISKGAKRLEKGQQEISKGYNLTLKGSQMMQENEILMQRAQGLSGV